MCTAHAHTRVSHRYVLQTMRYIDAITDALDVQMTLDEATVLMTRHCGVWRWP